MAVYDVFTFFNEYDMLEMRLEMLDPYVDKFVLIECVETFSGNQKPLYFKENKQRYEKYLHKVVHLMTTNPPKSFEDLRNRIANNETDELEKQVCIQALTSTNVPQGELHWLKEFYQKEMIRRALVIAEVQDDDLCFIGDLDEFWNPDLEYVVDEDSIYKLRQIVYSIFMDNRSSEPWAGTLLTKYKNVKNACLNHLRTPSKTKYSYIDNAGWHFTFMGGPEQIKYKIESYGHQEYNNASVKDNVKRMVDQRRDVLGRNNFSFWKDEESLPKFVKQNKEKYKIFF